MNTNLTFMENVEMLSVTTYQIEKNKKLQID